MLLVLIDSVVISIVHIPIIRHHRHSGRPPSASRHRNVILGHTHVIVIMNSFAMTHEDADVALGSLLFLSFAATIIQQGINSKK